MKGVILDADTLGPDIDLAPVTSLLDEWQVFGTTQSRDIVSRIAGAEVVLTNKVPLTQRDFEAAHQLRLVSILATGFNHIDLAAARTHDVTVCNARGYATPSVVQHTISLMLALSNNLLSYTAAVHQGHWQQSDVFALLDKPIIEVSSKRLGIIGYGELGRGVAEVARALGMEVLIAERPNARLRPGRTPFETVLTEADYITLHCPLNEATTHLINQRTIGLMKPSAFLINTARGGLIDETALVEALNDNRIAGAAIDVVKVEPPPNDDVLINSGCSNLIITPHSAWGAIESRQRLISQTRENIAAYLEGVPQRIVNPG